MRVLTGYELAGAAFTPDGTMVPRVTPRVMTAWSVSLETALTLQHNRAILVTRPGAGRLLLGRLRPPLVCGDRGAAKDLPAPQLRPSAAKRFHC